VFKILVINDGFPHNNNRTTIFFNNIIPHLSKLIEVKVYWLITDDYGRRHDVIFPQYEHLFMSDFKNAIEVCEKIKPNTIYHLVGWHIVDYAFMIAKEKLKIPSFSIGEGYSENDHFDEVESNKSIFLEYFRQFFETKSFQDQNDIKKSRGMNFIKKTLFTLKTIMIVNGSWVKGILLMYELFQILRQQMKIGRNMFEKFGTDIIFAENMSQVNLFVKAGVKCESIVIVGNPVFDNAFTKSKKLLEKTSNKLKILFITANISGLQGNSKWTKSKRNDMTKEIADKLNNASNTKLTIKIHPTSENYKEYETILESFENVNLNQIDDIVDLLEKSDIVITPCTTTAATIALVMKKPIIIWNHFQVMGDLLLRKGFALECKNKDEIEHCVENVREFTDQNKEKIDKFIKEEYGDGNATKRIVMELEKWIKNILK
tara:strand:- start:263 stop:1555 length:1293 start_codon:yes stop_codon:yes gene_type:complete